jgi:hypothetical protein
MSWRPTEPRPEAPNSWMVVVEQQTRCKHGEGPCERCGTTNERDVVHRARTPGKRATRRLRRRSP